MKKRKRRDKSAALVLATAQPAGSLATPGETTEIVTTLDAGGKDPRRPSYLLPVLVVSSVDTRRSGLGGVTMAGKRTCGRRLILYCYLDHVHCWTRKEPGSKRQLDPRMSSLLFYVSHPLGSSARVPPRPRRPHRRVADPVALADISSGGRKSRGRAGSKRSALPLAT
jgi:hypothetical protein